MSEPQSRPMSFEQFRSLIAQELQIDEETIVPEASFVEDLYADSLRVLTLMLRMEELGIAIPIEQAWQIRTVGDAYRLYAGHPERMGGPQAAGEIGG